MYLSPLHIIPRDELPESGQAGAEYLLRLRKKLLVEFDLDNSVTILINDRSYSKDEVIRTIDLLLSEGKMELHLFIYRNRQLLRFLESDELSIDPGSLELQNSPEEISSELDPLLQERLKTSLKKCFDTGDFEHLLKFWKALSLFSSQVFSTIADYVNSRLLYLSESIAAERSNAYAELDTSFAFLQKKEMAVFLNALPPEFLDTIDTLVMRILNAMKGYAERPDSKKNYLLGVCEMLMDLKCGPHAMMQIIFFNHRIKTDQMLKDLNDPERTAGTKKDSWTEFLVYGVIVVVAILLKVAIGGSSSEKSSYKYNSGVDFEQLAKMQKNMEAVTQSLKDLEKLQKNPYFSTSDRVIDKVLLSNKTGTDLVLMTVQPGTFTTGNYSIRHGKTDTLEFCEGSYFMIYSATAKNPKSIGKILYRKYIIEKKISWPKQGALPVIRLDKKFLSKGKFENEKVIFAPEDADSTSIHL